jgi:hypothetical protein
MSHSKNNISMITILFFLGISLSQVSASNAITCYSGKSPDCCWVVQLWQMWGKSTLITENELNRNSLSCCSSFHSDSILKPSPLSIEGVHCSYGRVTKIKWIKKGLTNQIKSNGPLPLQYLTSLEEL